MKKNYWVARRKCTEEYEKKDENNEGEQKEKTRVKKTNNMNKGKHGGGERDGGT